MNQRIRIFKEGDLEVFKWNPAVFFLSKEVQMFLKRNLKS